MKLRKIGALVLAVMMIAVAGIVVADTTMGESGIANLAAEDKIIVIKKQITAFNPAESTVNAPTITYNYAIEAGSSGKTVKDANGVSTSTVEGVTEGLVYTTSVSWSAVVAGDKLTTAAGGHANTKDITINFTNVTFPHAGVYRYKITETPTYTNTGVVDGGGSHIRYLDVYVKNAATEGEYEIFGYVLFTNDNNIDGHSTAADEDKVSAAAKTDGFTGTSADKYYTYNLTITKTLSGDSGMNSHQFPFGITFTGSETGVLPIITTADDKATVPSTWTAAGTMASFNEAVADAHIKIANAGVVTVTGIPIGTAITIIEKNDVTGTTYMAASSGADTNAESKPIAPTECSNGALISAQTNVSNISDKNVTFTNTLSLISPTGYISRFAPYALLLIGGIALLVIATKRRKNRDHEED